MKTRELTVLAGESFVTVVVPTDLPTEERAELLRKAFNGEVRGITLKFPDGHWKGKVLCVADTDLADLAVEAMEFMGAIVDKRVTWPGRRVFLESEGYWAHGF